MKKLLLLLVLFVVGCDAFKPPPLETANGTVMEILPNGRYQADASFKLDNGEVVSFNTYYCPVWKGARVTLTFQRPQGYYQSYVYVRKCDIGN